MDFKFFYLQIFDKGLKLSKFQANYKTSNLKFTLKDNKENKVDLEDEFVVPIPSEPKLSVSDFKLMKVLGQGTYGFTES